MANASHQIPSGRPHVVVLGGGPAGSTTAALLATWGIRVTLVEAQRFPRHQVGESLQPAAFDYLREQLGIGEVFHRQGFGRKYGAVYRWGESQEPWSVLFDERLERDLPALSEAELLAGPYEYALNVDRAVFDHLILQVAAARGATIDMPAKAVSPLFEAGRCIGVEVERAGVRSRLLADVVVDATGHRCLLGRHLGTTTQVADLRATATYTYVKGAGGLEGALGRHAQLVHALDEGWAWFIPISDELTSVGVVCRARKRLSDDAFWRMLGGAGFPMGGPSSATAPLRFHRDWSYSHPHLHGPGFLMVGDAAAFVDPILSGGVDMAIRSACKAAHHVRATLVDPAVEASSGADYSGRVLSEYRAYLRLARYWYGHNRSREGLFWQAQQEVAPDSTALRAFVYLITGRYARDRDFPVFAQAQERDIFRRLGTDQERMQRWIESRRRNGRR